MADYALSSGLVLQRLVRLPVEYWLCYATLNMSRQPTATAVIMAGTAVAALATVLFWWYRHGDSDHIATGSSSSSSSNSNSKPGEALHRGIAKEDNGGADSRTSKGNVSQSNLRRFTVEICLSDIESVVQAIHGGATSIELCTDRTQGGITPSLGLIEETVRLARGNGVAVHVLIRPRPGLFSYSESEFDCIVRDIIAVKRMGATGVVVGILEKDGSIDVVRMAIVRRVSSPLKLTFHRAFDVCTQPFEIAIPLLLEIKCDRLLTSGRSSSASEGIESLKRIITLSDGQIEVIAAAGVTAANAPRLILESKVHGVHAGSSMSTEQIETYQCQLPSHANRTNVRMGSASSNILTEQQPCVASSIASVGTTDTMPPSPTNVDATACSERFAVVDRSKVAEFVLTSTEAVRVQAAV